MGWAAAAGSVKRWALLIAALALLNASVTFISVWPTLAVRPVAQVSLEPVALVLALALAWRWWPALVSRRSLRLLAAAWGVLIVARYAEVTTRALYGRSVNLYWDLTLLPDVGAMFAYVVQPRIILALVAAFVMIPLLLYVPVRWAIGQVSEACQSPAARPILVVAALLLLSTGIAQLASHGPSAHGWIAAPISISIAQEAVEFAREASGVGRQPLPRPPSVRSDLAHVKGADVMVLFVESYGVTSWERPEFAATLQPGRSDLADAIAETRRAVVTAVVESTTFGGESWLAHISLLSGTAVRDQQTNRRLMAERRDTLVTTFARAGYRTLGIFPGLHASWPEGRFYGFETVYTAPDLDYRGPPFGWWDVTDQFVLARTDALAGTGDTERPAFVFLPTISTHTPFTPVPPYQPDWSRLLTPTPYDADDLARAYEAVPDWTNLGPDYARAVAYLHETLSGYLRLHDGRDVVLVVLGDHQPPALVSGEGASWNVPVHVIASRAAVLDRLRARGFRDGLAPQGPVLARMDTLMPILLDAFGNIE
jgi:hypothetical protein